jgi:histidinol phosphatase-like PHP family hydrolase
MTPPSSAAWQPRDCHAHTTWSDGELDPPSMIVAVRARGVRPTISDHVTADEGYGLASVDAVRAYLDALEALDDPTVAIAGEFCWHASVWRELPAAAVRRFTHRLGSLHAIELPDGTLQNMFHGDLPPGLTPDAYMEIHIATLERFAADMPVDILAHPTLLPVPLQALPIEELWTEPRETRAVNALRQAGIAFEISNRYRAHQRFVRRAYESGVRLSLGSDGHTPQAVGDIAWPLAVARAVGARDDELYDPFRHGSRTGAHPERAPRTPSVSAPERQPAPG